MKNVMLNYVIMRKRKRFSGWELWTFAKMQYFTELLASS